MAPKRRTYINLLIIIVLAVLALSTAFPNYVNRAIDGLNNQLSIINDKLNLPRLKEKPFKIGLDLQGGSYLVYEADLSKIDGEKSQAMQGLRDVIERRVNLFGVGEPMVRMQAAADSQRLVIELPGVKDVEEAIEQIGKTPYLEFREEIGEREGEEISFAPTKLTGQYLKRAGVSFNQTTFEPYVNLEFNKEGAELFKEITSRNINKQLAIFIDNVLISAPVVREAIPGGEAQITGSFTIEEAKELARNLNAGALPVPIVLISQKTIGPTLGKISLEKSLRAGIIGLLLVALFMLGFYRLRGFLAAVALVIYAVILLSLFRLIPVTLTLAGIGGVILSIGIAVDANVLIFERQKEETQKGLNFSRALEAGFSRAWPSIRDSNLTTLIVSLIMFAFGSSFVKGFALTLSLGVLVSMFSALFITRIFLRVFVGTRLEKVRWLWR